MNQDVAVPVRFEVNGNGVRVVNEMTGAVERLAAAEELLRQKILAVAAAREQAASQSVRSQQQSQRPPEQARGSSAAAVDPSTASTVRTADAPARTSAEFATAASGLSTTMVGLTGAIARLETAIRGQSSGGGWMSAGAAGVAAAGAASYISGNRQVMTYRPPDEADQRALLAGDRLSQHLLDYNEAKKRGYTGSLRKEEYTRYLEEHGGREGTGERPPEKPDRPTSDSAGVRAQALEGIIAKQKRRAPARDAEPVSAPEPARPPEAEPPRPEPARPPDRKPDAEKHPIISKLGGRKDAWAHAKTLGMENLDAEGKPKRGLPTNDDIEKYIREHDPEYYQQPTTVGPPGAERGPPTVGPRPENARPPAVDYSSPSWQDLSQRRPALRRARELGLPPEELPSTPEVHAFLRQHLPQDDPGRQSLPGGMSGMGAAPPGGRPPEPPASGSRGRDGEESLRKAMQDLTRETRRLADVMATGGGARVGAGGSGVLPGTGGASPRPAKEELTLQERARKVISDRQEKAELEAEVRRQGGATEESRGAWASMATRAAIPLAAIHTVGQFVEGQNAVARQPWMLGFDRRRAETEAIPLLGHVAKLGHNALDYMKGDPKSFAAIQRHNEEQERFSLHDRTIQQFGFTEDVILAKSRAATYGAQVRNLNVPDTMPRKKYFDSDGRHQPVDLSTLGGERFQREDLALQPLLMQREDAAGVENEMKQRTKNLEAMRKELNAKIAKHEEDLGKAVNAFQKNDAEARRTSNSFFKARAVEAGALALRLRDEILPMRERLSKLTDLQSEAEIARVQAATRRESTLPGGLENARVRLPILMERQAIAESQAVRLGMMGPHGRAMGQQSYEMLRQVGIENAPPELISRASSMFPDEVRKMAERAGVGLAKEARKQAPEEYRDDLPQVRSDVEKLRDRITAGIPGEATALAEAVGKIMELRNKELIRQFGLLMFHKFNHLDLEKLLGK